MPHSRNAPDDVRAYKAFIDGLRAIAIVTVVASHIELAGLSGGFVGVDVFFVISGYLIINQIVSDVRSRRFKLMDFYARRTLRILPAFLLVSVTTLALATLVVLQPEVKEFSESFALSTLMLANHHYLAHQGYFDSVAFTKPLLHMWSLGVEEQFYWATPLLILATVATAERAFRSNEKILWAATTIGLAATSFAACVAFTYPAGHPNVSFYIMPTRGWEFILGGVAPGLVPLLRNRPAWISDALGWTGLAAISASVALYTPDTLYPSYRAALPALGAMFVIAGGLLNPASSPARILSSWPMVRIGLISYALYLWHWPLISFVRTLNYGKQNIAQEALAVTIAIALAIATYLMIEVPVRNWRHRRGPRSLPVVATGVATLAVVALCGYFWSSRVAPRFLPAIEGLEPATPVAMNDAPPVQHRGLLLGDSHAMIMTGYLQQRARQAGAELTVFAHNSCPPLQHTTVLTETGAPASYCPPFYSKVQFGNPEFAILATRWNHYLALPPSDPYYASFSLLPESREKAGAYEAYESGLAAEIAGLKRSGAQRILIFAPTPEFPWYAPYCVMRSIRIGVDNCGISRATVETRRAGTLDMLRRIAARFEGVRLIDPIDLFCTATVCSPHSGRTLYFIDTNHLSQAGIERLYAAYERDIRWAMTGTDTPR